MVGSPSTSAKAVPSCGRFSSVLVLLASLVAALVTALVTAPGAHAWTWPAAGPVLRPFSLGADTYAGGQHRGVDIGAELGSPVLAPAAGTVSFVGSIPQRRPRGHDPDRRRLCGDAAAARLDERPARQRRRGGRRRRRRRRERRRGHHRAARSPRRPCGRRSRRLRRSARLAARRGAATRPRAGARPRASARPAAGRAAAGRAAPRPTVPVVRRAHTARGSDRAGRVGRAHRSAAAARAGGRCDPTPPAVSPPASRRSRGRQPRLVRPGGLQVPPSAERPGAGSPRRRCADRSRVAPRARTAADARRGVARPSPKPATARPQPPAALERPATASGRPRDARRPAAASVPAADRLAPRPEPRARPAPAHARRARACRTRRREGQAQACAYHERR